ncbi:hypothetical protein LJK88_50380 [Paenibacillus sp. P26]|nr:hypothetical protein LJK88_50380 [Paenibacillus sp. P26]
MENTIYRFKDLPPGCTPQQAARAACCPGCTGAGIRCRTVLLFSPRLFKEGSCPRRHGSGLPISWLALRKHEADATFAVRSSALSEDSAQASFAGEFETVLDVQTDGQIRDAIYTVYGSSESERVKAYSSAHGMDALPHQVAVVVQRMVPSELAGVLFSADPVTGDLSRMTGNFVHGFGEQLVSGEADAYPFTFARPKGIYEGPREFKPYAAKLYSLAARLEKEFGGAQDIEWAVAKGSLYILQARPITTLKPGNPDTYEWNDSFTGDFLWTNTNVGKPWPAYLHRSAGLLSASLTKSSILSQGIICFPAIFAEECTPISVWGCPSIPLSANRSARW